MTSQGRYRSSTSSLQLATPPIPYLQRLSVEDNKKEHAQENFDNGSPSALPGVQRVHTRKEAKVGFPPRGHERQGGWYR
eukprot:449483-Rhodomonas_salina.4